MYYTHPRYPLGCRYAIADRTLWRVSNTLTIYYQALTWKEVVLWMECCPDSLKANLIVLDRDGRTFLEVEVGDERECILLECGEARRFMGLVGGGPGG